MSSELEFEKAKRAAAEKALQDTAMREAAERQGREHLENELRKAEAQMNNERQARVSAERAAAAEKAAREIADTAAKNSEVAAQNERAARKLAEQAASEANAQALVEHAERESAEKVAAAAVKSTVTAKPAPPSAAPPPAVSPPAPSTPSWLIPLIVLGIAGFLLWFIALQWNNWESDWLIKTDDAYVRADVAPLSTKVVGTVVKTNVKDFDKVKAGQVLVELKNDDYKAQVDQAEAAVLEAETKLSDMKERKEQQDARVVDAQTVHESTRAGVSQAEDNVAAAESGIEQATAGIAAARAAIAEGNAGVKSAMAEENRANQERTRQEGLLALESATKQRVEQVVDDNDRASANLEAKKAGLLKAQAELAAKNAELTKAKQQLRSARTEQDRSQLTVRSRETEVTEQKKQRELLDGEEIELRAELAARKAALQASRVNLDYSIVRAPEDGVVGELKVKPGQLVSAGTQVITIISSTPWILANYRETQLAHVKAGDSAEITVDALPGTHFKGHVLAVAPASGAQFSLLPPDNASGNFTKITQRIPVKIALDEDQNTLSSLRPGMSVTATIQPGNR
ncbi:MAG TPA: HlyD family secretion protein [Planktothrix sp.]|jgi:membrane fusion protein (multidrug efflux system)